MRRALIWILTFLALALTPCWCQAGSDPQALVDESTRGQATDQSPPDQNSSGQSPNDNLGQAAPTPPSRTAPQALEDESTLGQAMDQSPPDQNPSGQSPVDNVSQAAPTPPSQTDQTVPLTAQPSIFTSYNLFPNQRSYFIAGFNVDEGVQINPANGLPNSASEAYSTTKVYGVVTLSKIVRRFNTRVDYKGGEFFYRDTTTSKDQTHVQQLTVSESVRWQRTSFLLEESFSDYPAASFGSSGFGGASAYNLGFGGGQGTGISDFFGFNDYGGYGGAPHFTSVSLAEASEQLTPRSAVSVEGAYAVTDYLGQGNSINSQQTSVLAGYQYTLTPRSTIDLSYGYQNFKFPGTGGSTIANSFQVGYQRSLTPRLNFQVSAGPSFIQTNSIVDLVLGPVTIPVPVTSHQSSITALASLAYAFERESLSLTYERLTTGGSGFFSAATTDVVTAGVGRALSPRWTGSFTAGFSRLGALSGSGASEGSYKYGFFGAAVQRPVGRHLTFQASYQYSDETGGPNCSAAAGCSGYSQVHTATLSISWRTLQFPLSREKTGGLERVPDDNQQSDVPAPMESR